VKSVLEADDRRPAGRVARDLDRVLDRLGAGVDEEGALVVGPGRDAVQPLGQRDIGFVGRDRERGMGQAIQLGADGGQHVRMAVSDVQRADPAGEIDEAVVVGVGDNGVLGPDDCEGRRGRHATRRRGGPAGREGEARRTGDLGDQPDDRAHRPSVTADRTYTNRPLYPNGEPWGNRKIPKLLSGISRSG
jgi:hypothetical protein